MSEMYEVTVIKKGEKGGKDIMLLAPVVVMAANRDAAILKAVVEPLHDIMVNADNASVPFDIDNLEVRTRPFVGTEQ